MTQTASGIDRRQRKSRAALRQALIELLTAKPYEAITVEDVVGTADVARATFYAHYRDKGELLLDATRELLVELQERVLEVAPTGPTPTTAGVAAVFDHAQAHPELYRVLITGEGGPEARAELITVFTQTAGRALANFRAELKQQPRTPMTLVTSAFVGSLLATIEHWLAGQLPGNVAQISRRFLEGQISGLEWSLGFKPGELKIVAPSATSGRRGATAPAPAPHG